MTDGSLYCGAGYSISSSISRWVAAVSVYGASVGTNMGSSTGLTSGKGIGIVSDTSKSGIIVEPDTQIKMIIKY